MDTPVRSAYAPLVLPTDSDESKDEGMREVMNLMRLPEVLALLGVSESTLRRLIKRAEFPHGHMLCPRIAVWRREDVWRWIDDHCPLMETRGD